MSAIWVAGLHWRTDAHERRQSLLVYREVLTVGRRTDRPFTVPGYLRVGSSDEKTELSTQWIRIFGTAPDIGEKIDEYRTQYLGVQRTVHGYEIFNPYNFVAQEGYVHYYFGRQRLKPVDRGTYDYIAHVLAQVEPVTRR
jgi:hypothetical protein